METGYLKWLSVLINKTLALVSSMDGNRRHLATILVRSIVFPLQRDPLISTMSVFLNSWWNSCSSMRLRLGLSIKRVINWRPVSVLIVSDMMTSDWAFFTILDWGIRVSFFATPRYFSNNNSPNNYLNECWWKSCLSYEIN